MGITILLADDHKIMREGLRSLIEKQPDMKVVGEAEDGRTTLQLAEKLKPDIIIMDITMPDLNGIEATRQIHSHCPKARVIALSMHSDRLLVAEMFKAGASGYLLKDCAFSDLARAVNCVNKGQVYLSPGITGVVVDGYVHHLLEPSSSILASLTPREREVLQLLAEGKSTKEIAFSLRVSMKTVETHRRKLMDKLKADSIAEVTRYAIREGLTPL